MKHAGMSAATIIIERLMTMTNGAERKKVEHDSRKQGEAIDVESKDDVTAKAPMAGGPKGEPWQMGGLGGDSPFPTASGAVDQESVNPKTKSVKKAPEPTEGETIESEIPIKGIRFTFRE